MWDAEAARLCPVSARSPEDGMIVRTQRNTRTSDAGSLNPHVYHNDAYSSHTASIGGANAVAANIHQGMWERAHTPALPQAAGGTA